MGEESADRQEAAVHGVPAIADGPVGTVQDDSISVDDCVIGLGGEMRRHALLDEPISIEEFHAS